MRSPWSEITCSVAGRRYERSSIIIVRNRAMEEWPRCSVAKWGFESRPGARRYAG